MCGVEENPERPEDFNLEGHGFVLVWDFMGRDLGLKNADLVVYARIFGFENSGKAFYESKSGTARFFGLSERAVFDAVKRLKEKDLIMEAEPCAEARRIGSKCYKVAVEPLQAIGIMRADHEGFSYEDLSPHEDASGADSPVHEDASPSRVGGHEDPSLPSMKEVHPIPKSKNNHFE